MRVEFLSSAVIIVLAFSGLAKASIITDTVTGTIIGDDGQLEDTGFAGDALGLFGNTNEYGSRFAVSLSLDLDSLACAPATSTAACTNTESPGFQSLADETSDGILTETVGVLTSHGSSAYSDSNVAPPGGTSGALLVTCQEVCSYPIPYLEFYVLDAVPTEFPGYNAPPNLTQGPVEAMFFGPSQLPVGQLDNAAAIQTYMNDLTFATITIINDYTGQEDTFTLADLSVSAQSGGSTTPEPTTCCLMAAGLCGAILLKRHTQPVRQTTPVR